MKKRVVKQELAKTSRHKNVFRNLIKDLFTYGTVKTTLAKAKSLKRNVDKLLSKIKDKNLSDLRILAKKLGDFTLSEKIVDYALKHKEKRRGGYVAVRRLAVRRGDSSVIAKVVLVDWVAKPLKIVKKPTAEKKVNKVKEEKRA